jgi:cytochrome c oxidase subunit 2
VKPLRRLLLLGALAGLAPAISRSQPRLVQVRVKRFSFEPAEIRLARGEAVTLELTTLDVPMGFALPDFGLRSDIVPGAASRLQFTPEKRGEFAFHCDVFCGSGHEEMGGTVIVK